MKLAFGVRKTLSALLLSMFCVICIAGAFVTIFRAPTLDVLKLIANVFFVLGGVSAILYCAAGYQKKAAIFYKAFGGCAAAVILVAILIDANLTQEISTTLALLMYTVAFALTFVATFAKDIGKKATVIIAFVNLGTTLVVFVKDLCIGQSFHEALFADMPLLLCVVFLVMVFEKYHDKEERISDS